jgi:hypothetical protein
VPVTPKEPGIKYFNCSENQLSGNIPFIPGIMWLD